eukprot:SAG11_NODE_16019_length_559_cov_0.867391_1_plen_121_part_00
MPYVHATTQWRENLCHPRRGPEFQQHGSKKRGWAVAQLANAYSSALLEFLRSGIGSLRLLPVSGGIFAGPFLESIPAMTWEALLVAMAALSAEQLEALRAARLELCIFEEADLVAFQVCV